MELGVTVDSLCPKSFASAFYLQMLLMTTGDKDQSYGQ